MGRVGVRNHLDWAGIVLYSCMTIFGILMLAPLVYLVSTAFKPLPELFLFPPRFWVMNPTIKNFTELWSVTQSSVVPFSRYVFNSILVASCIVVIGVLIASLAAYPLSKHHGMPFRGILFHLIILALMFSPQVTGIPQYLVISNMGILNTYIALIFPGLAAPLGLFLIKQFLDQVPDALLEAARIDGASEWKTFVLVVLPMLQPAIATYTLLIFTAAWNDAGSVSLYTTSDQMKNLPFAISTITGGTTSIARAGSVAAASFIMMVPTIVIFIVTQKRVMETMAHSGIKA